MCGCGLLREAVPISIEEEGKKKMVVDIVDGWNTMDGLDGRWFGIERKDG